jgi:hypothetical protein
LLTDVLDMLLRVIDGIRGSVGYILLIWSVILVLDLGCDMCLILHLLQVSLVWVTIETRRRDGGQRGRVARNGFRCGLDVEWSWRVLGVSLIALDDFGLIISDRSLYPRVFLGLSRVVVAIPLFEGHVVGGGHLRLRIYFAPEWMVFTSGVVAQVYIDDRLVFGVVVQDYCILIF